MYKRSKKAILFSMFFAFFISNRPANPNIPMIIEGSIFTLSFAAAVVCKLQGIPVNDKLKLLENIKTAFFVNEINFELLTNELTIHLAQELGQLELLKEILGNSETEESLINKQWYFNIAFWTSVLTGLISGGLLTKNLINTFWAEEEQPEEPEKIKKTKDKKEERSSDKSEYRRLINKKHRLSSELNFTHHFARYLIDNLDDIKNNDKKEVEDTLDDIKEKVSRLIDEVKERCVKEITEKADKKSKPNICKSVDPITKRSSRLALKLNKIKKDIEENSLFFLEEEIKKLKN